MILEELNTILDAIPIPVETGYFSTAKPVPDQYVVITPIYSEFGLHADNIPHMDTHDVRLTLYSKSNYTSILDKIVRDLQKSDFSITDRSYVDYDRESGYYQVTVDVQKTYTYTLEG